MQIQSIGFKPEGMIPPKYTCDGLDISPPLEWEEPPQGTKSFALVCEDPDAPSGTFFHWIIYNIPAAITHLPEKVSPGKDLPMGGKQGKNSLSDIGYTGPCPPSGTHRYYFKLYALDTMLDLKPGANHSDLLKSMKGHVLGESSLMGRYARH